MSPARRYWLAVVAVLAAYALHQLLTRTLNLDAPDQLVLLRPLDVDSERSIANWVGTIGWFVAASTFWRADHRILAVLAGLLSIEELVDHRDVVADAFPRSLVLGAAAVALVVAASAVAALPAGVARRLARGVLCWAVAARVFDELARIWFWAGTASYDLAVGVEEGLELAGIALVVTAVTDLAPGRDQTRSDAATVLASPSARPMRARSAGPGTPSTKSSPTA